MSKVNNAKSETKVNENNKSFVKNEANRDPNQSVENREPEVRLSVEESDRISAYKVDEIKKTRKRKSEQSHAH